jgi:deoxyribodipyrimidine photo-lyase
MFVASLMWREFYHHNYRLNGERLRQIQEQSASQQENMADMDTFDRWKQARTGMPIIDALMNELLVTGWMPNRGRRICASFLKMDANIDARYGYYFF